MEYWICEKGSRQRQNPDGSLSKWGARFELRGKGRYFEIETGDGNVDKYTMEDLSTPISTQTAIPFFNGASMFFLMDRNKVKKDLKYGYIAFDIDPDETINLYPEKLYGTPRDDWKHYINLKPMKIQASDVFAEMKLWGDWGIERANTRCKDNLGNIVYVTIPSCFIGREPYNGAIYIKYKKGKDVFTLPTQSWVKWEDLPEYAKDTIGAKNITFAFVSGEARKCSKNHDPMKKHPMTVERLLEDFASAEKAPPDTRKHRQTKNMEMEK